MESIISLPGNPKFFYFSKSEPFLNSSRFFQYWWLFNWTYLVRIGPDGDYMYKQIVYLSSIFYSLGIGFQIPRIVLLGHDHNLASFFMEFLSSSFLIAAFIFTLWKTYESRDCEGNGANKWLALIKYAKATSIGMIAVWSIFYMLVILALVLARVPPTVASTKDATTGCLVIFLLLVIAHVVLDVVVFDSYTRYQFGSFTFMILAMACVLAKRYEIGTRNTILTLIILILASFALIAKIINAIVRRNLDRKSNTRVHEKDNCCEAKTTPGVI